MKQLGKIVVCLASGLVLNAGARADDGVLPNNPYAPIVVRNVFGLNPLQPVDADSQGEPPPKITPNGIMSIFGRLQVLFKVAGTAKPGQPAKDDFYILSEGQRQDEIEVTHIDEKASLVTFNNHGTVQEIPLANAPAVSTPMPARAGSVSAPNGENGARGHFGGRPAGGPGAARNRGRGDDSTLTSVPGRPGYSSGQQQPQYSGQQQSQNTMTPEVQTIMIAANHAKAQQEGDPVAALYPSTPIDADAGVVPPPPPQ
jgi:hypothetical protein